MRVSRKFFISLLIATAVFLSSAIFTCAASNYKVIINKMECTHNEKYVENTTCFTKNIKWYTVNESIEIVLKPNVSLSTLWVKVTLYVVNSDLRYVPRFFINVTCDVCGPLNGKPPNAYERILLDSIKKYSNFAHPCPLSGTLRSSSVGQYTDLPPLMPDGRGYVKELYYTQDDGRDEVVFVRKLHGEITAKSVQHS